MSWRHGQTWWTNVRLRDGRRVQRSLGTSDRAVAREAERMLAVLYGRRDWQLLEAAAFGPLNVGQLYDAWRCDGLDVLRTQLSDVDLRGHVDEWQRWVERSALHATADAYRKQLAVLLPTGQPFRSSQLTRRYVSERLSSLSCSGSTQRRYLAAWSSFARYLVERDVIEANPVRSVKPPRENAPRELYLDEPDVVRLVDAQPEPFRALAALREGAGVEISAALRATRRDVDARRGIVLVRGSKNAWRERSVALDTWAAQRLRGYLSARAFTPDAPIFPGVTADQARHVQRRALKALSLSADYRLHDARHSYAVRHMKAGDRPELIAATLGHKDAIMVLRVYGKYHPTAHELARARLRAAR